MLKSKIEALEKMLRGGPEVEALIKNLVEEAEAVKKSARRASGPAVYKVKATAPVFNNDALAASAVAKYRTDMANWKQSNRPGSRPAPAQPVRPVVKARRPAPAPMHEYDRIASEAWAGGPYGAGFDSPFGKGKGR